MSKKLSDREFGELVHKILHESVDQYLAPLPDDLPKKYILCGLRYSDRSSLLELGSSNAPSMRKVFCEPCGPQTHSVSRKDGIRTISQVVFSCRLKEYGKVNTNKIYDHVSEKIMSESQFWVNKGEVKAAVRKLKRRMRRRSPKVISKFYRLRIPREHIFIYADHNYSKLKESL